MRHLRNIAIAPDARFFRLDHDWNAEPVAPEPEARAQGEDLLVKQCKAEWRYVVDEPPSGLRHFIFYLRDETFECNTRDGSFEKRVR